MSEPLTAVIDRHTTDEAPHTSRKKRVWLIILACVAALALTVTATFAVHFYLGLQQQIKQSALQAEQIASMQAVLSSQQEQLTAQESTMQEQQSTLSAQESTIQEQQSTLSAQESTIKKQEETIKQQQNTIKGYQSSNKKPTSISTPTTPAVGTVAYPAVDTTALAGKKLIALTFDDGPGPYTARLLDALKARGARATFFVVGTRVNSYANLIQRMEAEGHSVGNHSLNHKNLKYQSLTGIKNEIGTTAERIKNIIGHYPYTMRCPGGNYNATVRNYAQGLGIPIIQWSVDTLDWKYRNTASIIQRAKAGAKDGSIILMHDIYATTVNAAITLVDDLQAQGYTLVTVPELLAAKHGTVEAGKVYFHG